MPKKDYKPTTDAKLQRMKENQWMRDLHEADPRDSAELAGYFFHMMVDRVKEFPDLPIAKLFRAADFNPEHPFSWDYLLDALAEIHFVRQVGRTKVQDDAYRRELLGKVKKIVEGRIKEPNNNLVATLLLQRYGQDYPEIKSVEGFNSALKRHDIKAADVWGKSASRKSRPPQSSSGEPVKSGRVARVRKNQP